MRMCALVLCLSLLVLCGAVPIETVPGATTDASLLAPAIVVDTPDTLPAFEKHVEIPKAATPVIEPLMEPETALLPMNVSSFDIVVAIPTMRRWTREREIAPEKYLTNLVEGLIQDLGADQRLHTKFLLYNVDKEPEKHQELIDLQAKYASLIDVVNKPPRAPVTKDNNEKIVLEKPSGEVLEVSHTTMDWISGETHDATSLLFDARKRAPYVMFLEDDVKPTRHAITKLCHYLEEMQTRNIRDWFMLDLYTPRIGWGRNPLYVKNFERYDYECCTQAMLFRSDKLLDLLLYETLHSNLPIDDNIRDFSREDDSRGVYPVDPNLFEHIGRYSSNPEKSSNTVEHTSINFVP